MGPVRNVLTFDVEDWPQSTLDLSLPITASSEGPAIGSWAMARGTQS